MRVCVLSVTCDRP